MVLESDELRRVLTPYPTYDDAERDLFYHQMVYIGLLLVSHGVPVIFDATANRRSYRDEARRQIPQFLEVYVECPLETCIARDPKRIYGRVSDGAVAHVPGAQVEYERPLAPEVVVRGDHEDAHNAAKRVTAILATRNFLTKHDAIRFGVKSERYDPV